MAIPNHQAVPQVEPPAGPAPTGTGSHHRNAKRELIRHFFDTLGDKRVCIICRQVYVRSSINLN